MISFMIVGLIVAVSSNVKWKGTVEDEEEQDKFFKENAVTAKCHAYLRHLNDHFSRESFRTFLLLWISPAIAVNKFFIHRLFYTVCSINLGPVTNEIRKSIGMRVCACSARLL